MVGLKEKNIEAKFIMQCPKKMMHKITNDLRDIKSKIIIRDFGEVERLQVSKKGPGDFVTQFLGCALLCWLCQ